MLSNLSLKLRQKKNTEIMHTQNCYNNAHKLLSPLNPKEHLKDIRTSFVTKELIELSKVHVVSSGPVSVKNGFMKASELAERVSSLLCPVV